MDVTGLDKARILKALYNASGLTAPIAEALGQTRGNLTTEQAQAVLSKVEGDRMYFDYLFGRAIKVDIGPNVLDLRLFDRDNGEGAGERAILEEFTRPEA